MSILEMSAYGPVTLGALIDALERLKYGEDQKPRHIRYDFGGLLPDMRVRSYRGYYSELCIGFEDYEGRAKRLGHQCTADDYPNVVELLSALKGVLDQYETGYKGGEYKMHRGVGVFVAKYGDVTQCGIVGIHAEDSWQVVLQTDYFG